MLFQAGGCPLRHLQSGGDSLPDADQGRSFSGDSFAAIVSGHLTQAPPSIRARNPAVSPELEAVILRALSKNPANRQASARELLAELEAAIAPKPSVDSSASLQASPRLLITTFPGNCTIEVDGDFRGKTDAQGRFELRLPPGEYRIRFTSPGWNDLARTVVMGNSDQSLEIRLTHKTTVMATAPAVGVPLPASPATGSFAPPTGSPLAHTGKLRTSTGSLPPPPAPTSLPVTLGATPTSGINIALDTILTIVGVLAGLAAFAVFPSDPLSLRWDKTLMPGTSWWTNSAGVASVIVVPTCLLLADYVYPYRPVPFLVMVFNIFRVAFLVVVVGNHRGGTRCAGQSLGDAHDGLVQHPWLVHCGAGLPLQPHRCPAACSHRLSCYLL